MCNVVEIERHRGSVGAEKKCWARSVPGRAVRDSDRDCNVTAMSFAANSFGGLCDVQWPHIMIRSHQCHRRIRASKKNSRGFGINTTSMVIPIEVHVSFTSLFTFQPSTSFIVTGTLKRLRMQKFAFIFLAVLATLMVLAPCVEAAAIERGETNAERFARGLTPLPPVKRTRPSRKSE